MYAKKPKRTLEHINKMIMCFCLPPFVSFAFSAVLLLLSIFFFFVGFRFSWSFFRFLLSFSFSLDSLLRIKFHSVASACLWAWSQWPTTTGLLHIIPNSHTERLFHLLTAHKNRRRNWNHAKWCISHLSKTKQTLDCLTKSNNFKLYLRKHDENAIYCGQIDSSTEHFKWKVFHCFLRGYFNWSIEFQRLKYALLRY